MRKKMTIRSDSPEALSQQLLKSVEKSGLNEREQQEYCAKAMELVAFYGERLGAHIPVECEVRRTLTHAELRLHIAGEEYNPDGPHTVLPHARIHRVREQLVERKPSVFYRYLFGQNRLLLRSPEFISKLSFIKNPLTVAILIGVLFGLVCRVLPTGLASFFIDDVVSPALSTVTALLSGIMGPVLFLSVITSIASLNSIDRLNSLGTRIIRRFALLLTLSALIALGICAPVYRNFGGSGALFDPSGLVSMLLDIVPTNLFAPFVSGSIPQIVILGVAFGTALLMLGTASEQIVSGMALLQQWINIVWGFIRKLSPLIPMLNLAKVVYNNQLGIVLEAWKYFATVVAALVLFAAAKLLVTAIRCHMRPLRLLRKLRPLLSAAFSYGSHTAVIHVHNDVARDGLGIHPVYSDFWIPVNLAMFHNTYSIYYVCASFYAASVSGMSFSASSLLVLLLLSVQFSLASPGGITALTIIFTQLGLPTEYVGLFSVFGIVTKNIFALFTAMVSALEHLASAQLFEEVDTAVLQAESTT